MVAVTTDDHPQVGQMANEAADRGPTADRKGALAAKPVRHVVDLVALGCQVVNVMEMLDQAADPALIGDRKVVLEMKMAPHAGSA